MSGNMVKILIASYLILMSGCDAQAVHGDRAASTSQSLGVGPFFELALGAGANRITGSQLGGLNQTSTLRLIPDSSGSSVSGLTIGAWPGGSDDVTFIDGYWMWITNGGTAQNLTIANHSTGDGADESSWIATLSGSDVILAPGDTILLASHNVDWFTTAGEGWSEVNQDYGMHGVRAESTPSRTIGTAWQPNIARPTMVVASMSATCALTLISGQAGHLDLKVGPSNPPTMVVASVPCSNTGTGVTTTVTSGGAASYIVKPGDYVEADPVNTTGTPSFTLSVAEETL